MLIVFACSVLFLLLIHFTSADTASSSATQPSYSGSNDMGSDDYLTAPSIVSGRFYIDPAYREKTKKERLFDPQNNGMNAFEDVICEVTLDKKLDYNYRLTGSIMQEDQFSDKSNVVLYSDLESQGEPHSYGEQFAFIRKDDKGRFVYAWKVSGGDDAWHVDVPFTNGNKNPPKELILRSL